MPEWSGWLYLGGRWWRACRADTIGACATKLSKAADEEGIRDVDTVMTRTGAPVGPPLGRSLHRDKGEPAA